MGVDRGAGRKRDGHSHSQYCLHGSGEPTEALVERAIDLGFDTYTVTEHAPLPPAFAAALPYPPATVASLQLEPARLQEYLAAMHRLQARYAPHIRLLVGFELDFLPEHTTWTRRFLDEVGAQIDDAVLSVHYLPAGGAWRGIDLTPEELAQSVLPHYGGFAAFQQAYYRLVERAVEANLGPYKPGRIGHVSLCQKFQHYFPPLVPAETRAVSQQLDRLLLAIRRQGCELDHNLSGLDKPYCREPYPPDAVANRARTLGIPLIYGSDAHSVAEVGRHYDRFSAPNAAGEAPAPR